MRGPSTGLKRPSLVVASVACLWLAAPGGARAQDPPPERAAPALFAAVPRAAGGPDGATTLTVRWIVASNVAADVIDAAAAPVNRLEVVNRQPSDGPVRERAPELAPDQLVVVTVDAAGQETGWQAIRDPRLIRAELPKPDGELTGQAFFRPLTDFLLTLPNGRRTTAIHVYEQVVAAGGPVLRRLAIVAVEVP